jgi:hypothetical protein
VVVRHGKSKRWVRVAKTLLKPKKKSTKSTTNAARTQKLRKFMGGGGHDTAIALARDLAWHTSVLGAVAEMSGHLGEAEDDLSDDERDQIDVEIMNELSRQEKLVVWLKKSWEKEMSDANPQHRLLFQALLIDQKDAGLRLAFKTLFANVEKAKTGAERARAYFNFPDKLKNKMFGSARSLFGFARS